MGKLPFPRCHDVRGWQPGVEACRLPCSWHWCEPPAWWACPPHWSGPPGKPNAEGWSRGHPYRGESITNDVLWKLPLLLALPCEDDGYCTWKIMMKGRTGPLSITDAVLKTSCSAKAFGHYLECILLSIWVSFVFQTDKNHPFDQVRPPLLQ